MVSFQYQINVTINKSISLDGGKEHEPHPDEGYFRVCWLVHNYYYSFLPFQIGYQKDCHRKKKD